MWPMSYGLFDITNYMGGFCSKVSFNNIVTNIWDRLLNLLRHLEGLGYSAVSLIIIYSSKSLYGRDCLLKITDEV